MRRNQLVRGVLDLAVMAALRDTPSHGYELARRLQDAGFPRVSDASVYGTLKRLEDWGLTRVELVESVEGPARRVFSVTEAGDQWLAGSIQEWRELADAVGSLVATEEGDR